MDYILEFSNSESGIKEEVKLPMPNIDVTDKIDDADKFFMSENRTRREKHEYLFKLECDLIGEDKTKELVGGDFKSCDQNMIQTLFVKIIRAYDKPIDDIRAEEEEETYEQLGQLAQTAEQLNKVPDTAGKLNRMKK